MSHKKVILIDNYDSFVYNLADEFARLNCEIEVYRANWDVTEAVNTINKINPDLLIFSPGPGHPDEATLCLSLLQKVNPAQRILGVCLGHQCIISHFGGEITRAPEIMHGKPAAITHNGKDIFDGLSNPLQVARYHSLIGKNIPDCLKVTAQCGDIVMAVKHVSRPIYGLQFHPESILTPEGSKIIINILEQCNDHDQQCA